MKKILLVLAAGAFLISAYLTITHFMGELPACGEAGTCEVVLTSKYSEFMGIPLAVLGLVYDLGLVIALMLIVLGKKLAPRLMLVYLGVGFLVSVGLVCLQAFVIESFCIWCTVHAALIIFISILGFKILKEN